MPPFPEVPFGRFDGLPHPPEGPSRPARLPGLSIVLPCFQEPRSLAEAVEGAQVVARRASVRHEIIVVDDGSGDGTDHLAAQMTGVHRGVRLVLQVGKRGYGAAVRSGIAAATMPYVLIADAGYAFDGDELLLFMRELERADVVVGYRAQREGAGASSVWNWLAHKLYDVPIRDVDCGLRLYPRDLLRRLDLVAVGPMFSTELIVKTVARGATIAELGVSYEPRAVDRHGAPARGVRELLKLHRRLRRLASKRAL